MFDAWLKERHHVPVDFLTRQVTDVACINRWLSKCVAEARNRNDNPYSPVSVQSLLAGILYES